MPEAAGAALSLSFALARPSTGTLGTSTSSSSKQDHQAIPPPIHHKGNMSEPAPAPAPAPASAPASASASSNGTLRLPPPHRLLSDPQFHQPGFSSHHSPMPPMPMQSQSNEINRQLPPLHSLYPPPGASATGFHGHHPAAPPRHDLLPPASMITQTGQAPHHGQQTSSSITSNPENIDGASPHHARSNSVMSGLSVSTSPASSTVSSADSVLPLSMVSSASSVTSTASSTSKRRPTRTRTASTGSTGSVGSIASLSSSSATDLDALGRKKPKIPRNPTSWDPHDDLLLRHLKEQQKLGWKDIASHFAGRTPNACQFRWRRLMSGSLRGGAATPAAESNTNNSHKNSNWTEDAIWDRATQSPPSPPMIPATTTRPLVAPSDYEMEQEQLAVQETQCTPPGTLSQPDLPQNVAGEADNQSTLAEQKDSEPAPVHSKLVPQSQRSGKSASGKAWSQEEDDLVTRSDLRFEELSVLLPSRTENEIWDRIKNLASSSSESRS
ncbi:hypothetical protein V1525DRAFT_399904 [Lipomyces kononenkoae]|uniref:Uncharacterized protein n=1 Tax=Lipomyces kononenkoae TaxID=34357 RepID=A0ACC3T658_LIPKO